MMPWHSRMLLLLVGTVFLVSTCSSVPDASGAIGDWLLIWKKDAEHNMASVCSALQAKQLANMNCTRHFDSLVRGIAGRFDRDMLKNVTSVYKGSIDYVEHDQRVWGEGLDTEQQGTAARRFRHLLAVEDNPEWGLDFIDQAALPLDHKYYYDTNGTGVNVYVLDTGILLRHQEFRNPDGKTSRAIDGWSAYGGDSNDCHSHGTHVSAIIGGNRFGVAKNVTLHAVRVLDCQGQAVVSNILQGLDWVAKHKQDPAVVHMSIEGPYNSALNDAVEKLVLQYQVHVVVSAGNNDVDACTVSPASSSSALTVGAFDENSRRWSNSNWGPCLDLFAPGVDIVSAIITSDSSSGPKTGTSMAAPFVSGVAALYLGQHPGASPKDLGEKILNSALKNAVQDDLYGRATFWPATDPYAVDISSTPNRLLQSKLKSLVTFAQSVLTIPRDCDATLKAVVATRLTVKPSYPVSISAIIPAGWDGSPLASVTPAVLNFTAGAMSSLPPSLSISFTNDSQGTFFIDLVITTDDQTYNGEVQTVKVIDTRARAGDTAANARRIPAFPFYDSDDTTLYADNYDSDPANRDYAPDVVYSFSARQDTTVTVSTCGCTYDTKLILTTDPGDPSTYVTNDDDRDCQANNRCSKITSSVKGKVTYYIIVDGYNGAAGSYKLSVEA